jgi:hypothetical protein
MPKNQEDMMCVASGTHRREKYMQVFVRKSTTTMTALKRDNIKVDMKEMG